MEKLFLEIQKMPNDLILHAFVWLVIFDIISGLAKSFTNNKTHSTKGLLGVVKHLLVVCLVLIAYPYLNAMGFSVVSNLFVVSYIVMYGISLAENLGQLGLPLPKVITSKLLKLKDSLDEEEN